MADWLMEDGERRPHLSSGNSDFVYDEENSAWIEEGATPETTPVWRSGGYAGSSRAHSRGERDAINKGYHLVVPGYVQRYTGVGGDIIIPPSIVRIHRGAFCTGKVAEKLTGIQLAGPSPYDEETSALTSVIFQGAVIAIEDKAFWNCSNLTSVTFNAGIKEIRSLAFASCTCLTDINIPENGVSIERGAFYDCPSLNRECKNLLERFYPHALRLYE